MNLYEFFIGFRYLRSKKSQGFISFNTLLSIFIVFIGVFILIVVISVLNGFQAQIKNKILDVDSHVTISNSFVDLNGMGISEYPKIIEKVKNLKEIKSIHPFIQGQGILRVRTYINPVMIRGIGYGNEMPEDIKKFVYTGARDYGGGQGVIIGHEMAQNYSIVTGNWIELIVPKGTLSAFEGITPGLGKYRVVGTFKTGYYDFDTKLVVMSFTEAQRLYEVGNVAWGISIKLFDWTLMDLVTSKIQALVGANYVTMTAEERNHNLFYALKLEKLIMTIILFLVIISAGFTIMGTLVMVVMEKRKAIGVLKSMGARPSSIMVIFVLEGFLIGVTGAMLGVIFGLATALNLEDILLWIEKALNSILYLVYKWFSQGIFIPVKIIPKDIYYIDAFPTLVSPEFVTFIAIFAVFLATVAAIFPAWQASRLRPVETIRYE